MQSGKEINKVDLWHDLFKWPLSALEFSRVLKIQANDLHRIIIISSFCIADQIPPLLWRILGKTNLSCLNSSGNKSYLIFYTITTEYDLYCLLPQIAKLIAVQNLITFCLIYSMQTNFFLSYLHYWMMMVIIMALISNDFVE